VARRTTPLRRLNLSLNTSLGAVWPLHNVKLGRPGDAEATLTREKASQGRRLS